MLCNKDCDDDSVASWIFSFLVKSPVVTLKLIKINFGPNSDKTQTWNLSPNLFGAVCYPYR